MGILRELISLGRVFQSLLGMLVSGLVIFLAVMCRRYTMGVRRKIVKLGGSLVPVASALPAMIASIASIAHELLLFGIRLNCTTLISPALRLLAEPVCATEKVSPEFGPCRG